MKRRTLSVSAAVTAAVLAGGTLTACGGSTAPNATADKQSVTMWIYPVIVDEAVHKKFWADEVTAFKAANPNIDVKVEYYPWAKRDDALATAIASNTAPDVVYLIPDQLAGYAKNLEPVDKYLSASAKADYFDNVKSDVTLDGKMLGAPVLTTASGIICDKRALSAVGATAAPTTWDELAALGPKLKAKGIDSFNYLASPDMTLNMSLYPLLWQAGGQVFSADGKTVAFNQQPGVDALTFLKEQMDKGYVSKEGLTTLPKIEQTRLAQGKVACTWQYEAVLLEKAWGKANMVVGEPMKKVEQIGFGTVGSLSMLKTAKSKAAAGKWIDFVTNTENLKKYDMAASYFSPKKSTGVLYASDPVLSAQEKMTPMMTVGALNPKSRQVMGALVPAIQAVLGGQKEPQQALDDAAKEANQLFR